MRLKVFLPAETFLDLKVASLVAEGEDGSFGIKPKHVDFVSALVPGLLQYKEAGGKEGFIAVDRGILVKKGAEVRVSVRSAYKDLPLADLLAAVHENFLMMDEAQKVVRSAMSRLQTDFIRRFLELK